MKLPEKAPRVSNILAKHTKEYFASLISEQSHEILNNDMFSNESIAGKNYFVTRLPIIKKWRGSENE